MVTRFLSLWHNRLLQEGQSFHSIGGTAVAGVQVALAIRAELPEVPVILTSGYDISGWSERDMRDLAELGQNSVVTLKKPFLPQALLHVVRELVGAPGERARIA